MLYFCIIYYDIKTVAGLTAKSKIKRSLYKESRPDKDDGSHYFNKHIKLPLKINQ